MSCQFPNILFSSLLKMFSLFIYIFSFIDLASTFGTWGCFVGFYRLLVLSQYLNGTIAIVVYFHKTNPAVTKITNDHSVLISLNMRLSTKLPIWYINNGLSTRFICTLCISVSCLYLEE